MNEIEEVLVERPDLTGFHRLSKFNSVIARRLKPRATFTKPPFGGWKVVKESAQADFVDVARDFSRRATLWFIATLGILALSLALLGLTGRVSGQEPSPPRVVINELNYHPRSDDHGEEYIELVNTEAITVDLSGWRFNDGIHYLFPTGTVMLPGAYLVIANDPATVRQAYTLTEETPVVGPFAHGRLANSGERVALVDAADALVDEVLYDDHEPWPEEPDGAGPSLELINPAFDNASPCSWQSSIGPGTPGAQNSAYIDGNIPPCVTGATHAPAIPQAADPVTVTARAIDNQAVVSVTLAYRRQGETGFTYLPMTDDGTGGDTAAGDETYTAIVPPEHISGTIFPLPGSGRYVEFYIRATDDEGAVRIMPDGAPGGYSEETGMAITTSYLYWIEDLPPSSELPLYRLIVTEQNLAELQSRDIDSNEKLDATFIYSDVVYYNVGLRYRGESTRDVEPRPYRIKFRDAQEFEARERVNLVSDAMHKEAMTYDLFQRLGMPASDTRFVTLRINERQAGHYLDIEEVDRDFLRAHLPGDDGGNLYRGKDGADLEYEGSDPDAYRPYYLKKTNEDADDYTDVMSLTHTLTYASTETLVEAGQEVADLRQWMQWFAVQAVLDNHEGALWVGRGDDYFLYHRPSDDRFILISWDHDTLFLNADHTIWEPDWYAKEIVKRLLRHPELSRWYYQGVATLIEDGGPFTMAEMAPRIDALPDVAVSGGEKEDLKRYVEARVAYLWAHQIPDIRLSIETNGGANIVTTGDHVTLEGRCSPIRDVRINGSAEGVEYVDPMRWRYEADLTTRDNVFEVSDGEDTHTITVFRDLFHGGELTEDTTLVTSALPYAIEQDIRLSGGITLTIEPGVTLQFYPDRVIRVENGARLLAEGTASQPIIFTRREHGYWGGILLYNTQADNRIQHAVLEHIHEVISSPRSHGVSAYASHLTLADSVLRHMRRSNAVTADYDSTLYLLRNKIYDIGSDAVHATGGYAYIQGNTIHDSVYDPGFNPAPPEGIEISHMSVERPAVLLDNHIYNITDDCLDLNDSSARIERNIMHDCGDKGISIGLPSSTTVVNNLIYNCFGNDDIEYTGFGIAVKDGAVSRLVNNTLVDNRHGLGLYERHEGRGGPTVTVTNSIIWGNEVGIELRQDSALSMTHSLVQGEAWDDSNGSMLLDIDPLFRGPDYHDYRLRETSPCIDSGTPIGAPDVDIKGVTRPQGEGVDRGAHEFFEFFSVYLPSVVREE
ncbi:MAG: CotH kinase family protein [Anaerolineales bacterium]